jgi:hypothetical protein
MGFGGAIRQHGSDEPKKGLVFGYLVTASRSAEGQGYLLARVEAWGDSEKGRIEGF